LADFPRSGQSAAAGGRRDADYVGGSGLAARAAIERAMLRRPPSEPWLRGALGIEAPPEEVIDHVAAHVNQSPLSRSLGADPNERGASW